MVRQDPIFGEPAWPPRGVETEQAHMAPRTGREHARRHPGDCGAGLRIVLVPQRLEREIQRRGGTVSKRRSPDRERPAMEQRLSRFLCFFTAPREHGHDVEKLAPMVVTVGPIVGAQPIEQSLPCFERRERCIGGESADPARRERLKRTGIDREQRVESPHPALRETLQQHVGERRGALSFPRGGDLHPVHEVEVDVRVPSK